MNSRQASQRKLSSTSGNPAEPAVEAAAEVDVEPETATVDELVAAPEVSEESVEPAAPQQAAEPAVAEHDPEEDLWAAVLADAAEPGPVDHDEPDRAELDQILRPRRVRRRIVRQTRRPVQPATVSDSHVSERPNLPPPPPPAVLEVPPAPPAPPRTLRLPPVLPPRPPAQVSPWDMPAPPAFLPPPPPAMLSNVQPAPARFRPQVAVPAEPVVTTPSTRPCGNCGLELSAKVAFCRRCGTRQAPSA